jgi:hypothetical protein
MDDTVMTAAIKVSSNDIVNNELLIPVNLTMQLLPTSIDESAREEGVVLHQNVPNPFTDRTRIRFSVPEDQYITLRIFDVSGAMVSNPIQREVSKGSYEVEIFRQGLKPGIYFYQLTGSDFSETRKMMVR